MSRDRRSFRPSVCTSEALEERIMLSHAGSAAATTTHPAGAPPLVAFHHVSRSLGPVGAVGDSYTDEY